QVLRGGRTLIGDLRRALRRKMDPASVARVGRIMANPVPRSMLDSVILSGVRVFNRWRRVVNVPIDRCPWRRKFEVGFHEKLTCWLVNCNGPLFGRRAPFIYVIDALVWNHPSRF